MVFLSGPDDYPPYCGIPLEQISPENLGYPIDCWCNATIAANTDIAGPGVMFAFLFTGWLTFGFACISGYYRFKEDLEKLNRRLAGRRERERRRKRERAGSLDYRNGDIEMDLAALPAPSAPLNSPAPPIPSASTAPQLLPVPPAQSAVTAPQTSPEPQAPRVLPTPLEPPVPSAQPASSTSQASPVPLTSSAQQTPNDDASVQISTDDPPLKEAAKRLLGPLCDLQIVTGTAILIAGFAQGTKLTYYHEMIIASYWNVTVNSFWAAQNGSPKFNDVGDWPSLVRTATVLCSTILAVAFNIRANVHEYVPGYWSAVTPGRCYFLNHDQSGYVQAKMWVTGLVVYSCFVLMRMIPQTRKIPDAMAFNKVDRFLEDFFENFDERAGAHRRLGTFCRPFLRGLASLSRKWHYVPEALCRVFVFLAIQFLTMWSYGTGSFGTDTLGIAGFLMWNTLDVIDAKLSNLHLVGVEEMSWGFGQVLPIVILVTVLFTALDAFSGGETKVAIAKTEICTASCSCTSSGCCTRNTR